MLRYLSYVPKYERFTRGSLDIQYSRGMEILILFQR